MDDYWQCNRRPCARRKPKQGSETNRTDTEPKGYESSSKQSKNESAPANRAEADTTTDRSQASPPTLRPNFTCYMCNKNLSSKQSLQGHINRHTRKVLFPCPKCGRNFTEKQTLLGHLKTHDREEQRDESMAELPFKCKEGAKCKCAFWTLEQLNAHRKKHKLGCPFCSQAATSREFLNRHIFEHTGEFPEQCHKCKKYFTAVKVLRVHKCRG